MAGRHSSKRKSAVAKRNAGRRRRVLGAGSTAGAFLAFGLSPLAAAPAAKADILDAIRDPLINSLGSIDPTLGADLSSVATSFDPTSLGGQIAGSVSDPVAAAASSVDSTSSAANPIAEAFQTDFWLPLHTALQD